MNCQLLLPSFILSTSGWQAARQYLWHTETKSCKHSLSNIPTKFILILFHTAKPWRVRYPNIKGPNPPPSSTLITKKNHQTDIHNHKCYLRTRSSNQNAFNATMNIQRTLNFKYSTGFTSRQHFIVLREIIDIKQDLRRSLEEATAKDCRTFEHVLPRFHSKKGSVGWLCLLGLAFILLPSFRNTSFLC